MMIRFDALYELLIKRNIEGEWTNLKKGEQFESKNLIIKSVSIFKPEHYFKIPDGLKKENYHKYSHSYTDQIDIFSKSSWKKGGISITPEWAFLIEEIAKEKNIGFSDNYDFSISVNDKEAISDGIDKVLRAKYDLDYIVKNHSEYIISRK
jgi:hypothetical protein